MTSDAIESLVALGLTHLEAEIYRFLLRESPATGYRIAQGLGKPTANVYRSLETLRAKSALVATEDEPRRFRPVPAPELLERLQREFERHLDRTREALRRLPGPPEDEGIYHLRGREAVLDGCRRMLDAARVSVILDAFPAPLRQLESAIQACASRGLRVAVKAYAPVSMKDVHLVMPPDHEDVRRRWPVQWLNLVVDAEELLIAVFDRDGQELLEAVWSRNAWIAFILDGTLTHEIAFTGVRGAPPAEDALGHAIARGESLLSRETPGLHRLRRLLGLTRVPDDITIVPEESP